MEKYKLRSMSLANYIIVGIMLCWVYGIGGYITYEMGGVFFSIYSLIFMIPTGFIGYIIMKDRKRKRTIEELIAREDYRNIVVAGIYEGSTGGKYPRTYYVYLCEDPETKYSYESEWIFDIEASDIKMGDQVRLYESHAKDSIYWVDINHRESGKGLKKLSLEAKEFGEKSFQKLKEPDIEEDNWARIILVWTVGLCFLFETGSYINDRITYQNSISTTGMISGIEAINTTCSRKPSYSCTRFLISFDLIDLPTNYGDYASTYIYDPKSIKGHNQPASLSNYTKGDIVTLLIHKDELDNSFVKKSYIKDEYLEQMSRNLIFVWILGLITLIITILYLKGKPKKKKLQD